MAKHNPYEYTDFESIIQYFHKTKLDGINSDGKVKPTDVWAVLERQNPTTTVSVKEEANSDIKQGN